MANILNIKEKNSASPTIIVQGTVINEGRPSEVTLKIWTTRGETSEFKALDYEKDVYDKLVKQIYFEQQKNIPILRNLANTTRPVVIDDICKLLGLNTQKYNKLSAVLAYYSYHPIDIISSQKLGDLQRGYEEKRWSQGGPAAGVWRERRVARRSIWKKGELEYYTNKNLHTKLTFHAIILPTVNMITLNDLLEDRRTDIQLIVHCLKQIVYGIDLLYSKKIVHNDLHPGNIMLDKNTGNTYIYDFDRSYAVELGDNPLLSKKFDEGSCGRNSQCNHINSEGYAIDLYKILHYVFLRIRFNFPGIDGPIKNMYIASELFGKPSSRQHELAYMSLIQILIQNGPFFTYQFEPRTSQLTKCNLHSVSCYTVLQQTAQPKPVPIWKNVELSPMEQMGSIRGMFGTISQIKQSLRIEGQKKSGWVDQREEGWDKDGDVQMSFGKNDNKIKNKFDGKMLKFDKKIVNTLNSSEYKDIDEKLEKLSHKLKMTNSEITEFSKLKNMKNKMLYGDNDTNITRFSFSSKGKQLCDFDTKDISEIIECNNKRKYG